MGLKTLFHTLSLRFEKIFLACQRRAGRCSCRFRSRSSRGRSRGRGETKANSKHDQLSVSIFLSLSLSFVRKEDRGKILLVPSSSFSHGPRKKSSSSFQLLLATSLLFRLGPCALLSVAASAPLPLFSRSPEERELPLEALRSM